MDGLETLDALRRLHPDVLGVVITAHGSIRSAVDAIRRGAHDYVTKPFDNEALLLTVKRALDHGQLRREVVRLREELDGRQSFPGIVGTSVAIQRVLRDLPKIAATNAHVLITGESGTGKELVARSLHRHSKRANGPFVVVNCAAIPNTLIESEFFGHERGAFTDAKTTRIGCFEQAHGGSLFLDEVGELSLEAQPKLLRVLQHESFSRVGGRAAIRSDVRVIAATNRDLEEAVRDGRFREDLYWRLHVVPLRLPALRERKEDLPLLVDHFIDRLNGALGLAVTSISADALQRIAACDWPGNIRQLENALERAMILTDGVVIQASDIDNLSRGPGTPTATIPDLVHGMPLKDAIDRVERRLLEERLTQHRWNYARTAADLQIDRKTLFRKMREHGLASRKPTDRRPAS
jgi:DNA-binding NtrC family response regulator